MNDSSKLCFKWNRFEANSCSLLRSIRDEDTFKDVVLACEGGQVSAHKMVLSGCSSVLKSILEKDSQLRPVIYFKGVKLADIEALMDFVYKGEAYVAQSSINSFLFLAEDLKVNGLYEPNANGHSPKDNNNIAKKVSLDDSGLKEEKEPEESGPNIEEEELPGIRKLAAVKEEDLEDSYHDLFNTIQNEEQGDSLQNEDTKELKDYKEDDKMPDRTMLLAHISKETDDNGKMFFKCHLCWKIGSKENILSHLEKWHFHGMFTYNCRYCNKQYYSRRSLKSHLFNKHRDRD